MTITPSVVRLAKHGEEDALLSLLQHMHAEIGMFPFSEQKVSGLLSSVLNPDAPKPPTPIIIGVIGPPQDIQATICVVVGQEYYTEDVHLRDGWNYVRWDCRRSDHAKALIDFGKLCAKEMGLPFISGVVSTKRTEAKMRLYRRRFGTSVGGYFMYRPQEGHEAS